MNKYLFLILAWVLSAWMVATATGQQIPITFDLPQAGYVTLVIEDDAGNRVRNLIQNTYFDAGSHTIYWDGYDEGVAANYNSGPGSNYDIARLPAEPGTYRVKALVHNGIDAVYEFSPYSPGTPPWKTGVDDTGAWGSDHQSYWGIEHWPADENNAWFHSGQEMVLAYSKVGESGYAFLYLDANGRKVHGVKGIKGSSAVYQAARDRGPRAGDALMYGAFIKKGTLSVYRILRGGNTTRKDGTLKGLKGQWSNSISGVTAWNEQVAVSLREDNLLAFFQMKDHDNQRFHRDNIAIEDPRGLWTEDDPASDDPDDVHLYVARANTVERYKANFTVPRIADPVTVVDGLEDAQQVYIHEGELYVSDWGSSHQIKVFDLATGQQIRTIGKAGGPQVGFYDEARMAYPTSMRIDSNGKLWVAERHKTPKRISRWNAADGSFDKAWYGGPKYGGGGMIDPTDSTRFYYSGASGEQAAKGIEMRLDWTTGTYRVSRILVDHVNDRTSPPVIPPGKAPEYARKVGGFKYLVNNNQEKNGRGAHHVTVWRDDEHIDGKLRIVGVVGVVAAGNKTWEPMRSFGGHQAYGLNENDAVFAWSDLNENGEIDGNEVQYTQGGYRGYFVLDSRLSILNSQGYRSAPPTINADGIPVWDLSTYHRLPDFPGNNNSTDILAGTDVSITALGPITAVDEHGKLLWTYHSQWPNRNNKGGRDGVKAPLPLEQYPGQILAHTRFMGDLVTPGSGEAGPIFALNSEKGPMYLLTRDGYFITKIMEDARSHPLWRFPEGVIQRGDVIRGVSPKEEHFWPSISQSPDGTIYIVAGKQHSSILRLEGFDSVRRYDFGTVTVNGGGKDATPRFDPYRFATGDTLYAVTAGTYGPQIDGTLSEWPAEAFKTVDAFRNYQGAVGLTNDRLVIALNLAGNDALLQAGTVARNAELPEGGGGIDLWVGKEGANNDRSAPAPGDVRIFITRKGDPHTGRLVAMRYEANAAESDSAYTFESPIGTYAINDIRHIEDDIEIAQANGFYEVSIPLSTLNISSSLKDAVRFDLGVVLGDGREATARTYWNDKVTNIVDDLPSEMTFYPDRWGILKRGSLSFGESSGSGGSGGVGGTSHLLPLKQGWNIVSSYMRPTVASMASLLKQTEHLVIVKDGQERLFVPSYGIDNIGTWSAEQAYQIYVTAPDTLVLKGTPVQPETTELALQPGWNLIPYLSQTALDPATALADVADDLVLVKNGYGEMYFPDYDANQLDVMVPGEGYKVYLRKAASLTYPADDAAAQRLAGMQAPQRPAPTVGATGSDATLVVAVPTGLDGYEVQVETAGGSVVGRGFVEDDQALVVVRGDNKETDGQVEGARPDEALRLKAVPPQAGAAPVSLAPVQTRDLIRDRALSDSLRYRKDAIWYVTAEEVPSTYSLEQNYPNPFNPSTIIRYKIPEASPVTLKVFNTLGQEVAVLVDEEHTPGIYEVTFAQPHLASGLYVYRLQAGAYTKARRMLLVK